MNEADKPKLNYIGIGAEKAGTTWLSDCLAEHPEICLPQDKELFFFNEFDPHFLETKNRRYEKWGFAWYRKKFSRCGDSCIKGEFTPTYLYCPKAARRIKKHYPEIKLIAVLREPGKRAFSQYLNDKKIGLHAGLSFEEALEKYPSYIEKGRYCKYLKNYFGLFPKANILIILFDEIKQNPGAVCRKLYGFLGVENIGFKPGCIGGKANAARQTKFSFLNRAMVKAEYLLMKNKFNRLHRWLEISGIRRAALWIRDINTEPIKNYPKMKPETKAYLKKYFIRDIEGLEKAAKLDLSAWH